MVQYSSHILLPLTLNHYLRLKLTIFRSKSRSTCLYAWVLCCLLMPWCGWAHAADEPADPDRPYSQNEGWVEKKINPSTEWVERFFSPITRWVEGTLQGQKKEKAPVDVPFEGEIMPSSDYISPVEAARLLLLLHPGKILNVRFEQSPLAHYQIKLLSDSGLVSTYNLRADNGILLPSVIKEKAQ